MALSLVCKQCNHPLRSVAEAQEHGEITGHSQFEESTEAVSSARSSTYANRAEQGFMRFPQLDCRKVLRQQARLNLCMLFRTMIETSFGHLVVPLRL